MLSAKQLEEKELYERSLLIRERELREEVDSPQLRTKCGNYLITYFIQSGDIKCSGDRTLSYLVCKHR